jgi:hypothetical protein
MLRVSAMGVHTASVPGVLGNFLLCGTVSKRYRQHIALVDLLFTSLRSEAPYLGLLSAPYPSPNRPLRPRRRITIGLEPARQPECRSRNAPAPSVLE